MKKQEKKKETEKKEVKEESIEQKHLEIMKMFLAEKDKKVEFFYSKTQKRGCKCPEKIADKRYDQHK